jgi:anti-anti-sigma factor
MGGSIRMSRSSAVVIVSVQGALDQKVAVELHDLLLDLIVLQGHKVIVIDLANLERADVIGTAVLAGATEVAREQGKELRIHAPRPEVAETLWNTGTTVAV